MRKLSAWFFTSFILATAVSAFPIYYKEQYYKLYHIHYIQYPDDTIENIYYLEQAQKADFCNPLYALAKIEDKKQWERYRYLMDMQINLKLIEQHLYLGAKWDKQVAYFYNAPWKRQNLESLETAETCYRTALLYWKEAVQLSEKALAVKWINLEEVQAWEDAAFRISSGALNYERTINDELARLARVRATFEAMDDSTY